MLNEFKKFAFKGNVLDLAIGVIMGAAFGKIVSSLVTDIMMPLIQIIIDFLITAVAIFIFVKAINTAKEKMAKEETEEKAPEVDSKEELLKEIRDLLKEGK